MKRPGSDDLMTTDELCSYLRIKKQRLFNMRRELGGPPAVRLGKTRGLRWRRSDVDAWLDERREVRPERLDPQGLKQRKPGCTS